MPLSGKTDEMASVQPAQQPYDHRFPRRGIAGDRGVSSRRFGQVGTIKQKAMLSRADQGIPTSLGNTQLFARVSHLKVIFCEYYVCLAHKTVDRLA